MKKEHTFLWCGLSDGCVEPENSYLLEKALVRQQVPYQFHPVEGVEHGVGIGEGLLCEGWFEEAVQFWERHR